MENPFKDKKAALTAVKNALLVIVGSIILAFGFGIFIVPFSLVTGGVSGVSVAIASMFPEGHWLTVDLCVTILTWALFFVGLIFLGKAFALKTLISSIVYPIALSLFMRLASSGFLGGVFDIYSKGVYHTESGEEIISYAVVIIASVFGGVLVGVGCALTFRGGGSTGGLDILALIAAKYIKGAKSSVMIFVFDAAAILLGFIVMQDIIMCLLGIASAFVGALVIDKVFLGATKSFIAHIVSDKYEQINDAIIHKIERGSTLINAVGGYSGTDKKMIMVSFTMTQYAAVMAIISSIDPDAFVTVHRAHEINGEGWTR